MSNKIPTLRPGLSVSDLLGGTWMVAESRYTATDELVELNDALIRAAAQGLIDHANGGGRVTRRTVINTLCGLSQMLTFLKDHITDKMSRGELTPSVLDKLAGI